MGFWVAAERREGSELAVTIAEKLLRSAKAPAQNWLVDIQLSETHHCSLEAALIPTELDDYSAIDVNLALPLASSALDGSRHANSL